MKNFCETNVNMTCTLLFTSSLFDNEADWRMLLVHEADVCQGTAVLNVEIRASRHTLTESLVVDGTATRRIDSGNRAA